MSRNSYNNEKDWERRKAYLIRSLFQDDISPQSSKQDEEESLVSYISGSAQLASASTEDQPERPCSPLPPLIIEVEPNKHDEPEEYYQKFEKKIMKIYKRMFIEGRSDASNVSDSESTDMSLQSIRNEYSERRASFGIVDYENTDLQTDANNVMRNNGVNDFEMLHQIDSKEENENHNNDLVKKDTGLKLKTISDNNSASTDESEGIEIMRTPRIMTSMGSLQNVRCEDSKFSDDELNERENLQKSQTESESSNESVSNAMDYEESIDYDVLHTSLIQKNNHCENTALTRKRKSSSPVSSPAKTVKYVSTQTNSGYQVLNRRILSNSIFVGTPRVFNLCSFTCNENMTDGKGASRTEFIPVSTTDDLQEVDVITNPTTDSPERSLDSEEKCKRTSSEIAQKGTKTHSFSSSVEDTSENIRTSASSDYAATGRQVRFKADVHRDATGEIAQKVPSLIYEPNGEEVINTNNFDDKNDNDEDLAVLKENDISDNNSTSTDESEGIEIMRTPRFMTSMGSLQNVRCEDSKSSDDELNERENLQKSQTESESSNKSVSNVMDYEESIDYDVLHTSLIQKDNRCENTALTRKRKISSPVSSPAKTVKYADVSTQTNSGNQDLNRRILSDSIFVGTPRVFTLCSCTSHVCSC